jgi:hypothetical protein
MHAPCSQITSFAGEPETSRSGFADDGDGYEQRAGHKRKKKCVRARARVQACACSLSRC